MIDELTKPPAQETEGDITVSLSRAQADSLIKAGRYVRERVVWGDRARPGVDTLPAWDALQEGIDALKGATNDR